MPILRTLGAAISPLSNLAVATLAPPAAPKAAPGGAAPVKGAKKYGGAAVSAAGKPVANTVEDHVAVVLSAVPKLIIAALALKYSLNGFADPAVYATLSWAWVAPIIVRDLAITFGSAGVWDFIVYSDFSPLKKRMAAYKFNSEYATWDQILHDMRWALVSTFVSTAWEVFILHGWATGRFALHALASQDWTTDGMTIAALVAMPYLRLTHFYTVHRAMHPWRWEVAGVDIGAFLYRHVHKLHHDSDNPTSWSGVSMHPVESTAYYSAMMIPVLMGSHPIVMLLYKVDLTVAALLGHDGFSWPGNGSQPHWLHHDRFECNFGENYAPWDYLFGTFAATPEEADRIIAGYRAAAKAKGGEAKAVKGH